VGWSAIKKSPFAPDTRDDAENTLASRLDGEQKGPDVSLVRYWSPAARRAAAQAHAIRRFWSWWRAKGAREAAAAIRDGEPERMFNRMARHLTAIHPGLIWEFAEGSESKHVLVVTSEGDPVLRAITSRWRLAAPPAGALWSYSSFRLPAADPAASVVTLGRAQIDVTSATVSAEICGAHVDLTVYHPGFVELPVDQHLLTAFLLLDTVLGEAAVDTWVGTVAARVPRPQCTPAMADPDQVELDPMPLIDLPALVRDLENELTDSEGGRPWLLSRGTADDGDVILASAQVPLRAASAPHLDTHVDVSVSFSEWTPRGLPAPGSLRRLRDFQADVSGHLGRSGRVVAHETHRGVRTLHLYVDSTTFAAKQLRSAIANWNQGTVSVTEKRDPSWDQVQHLRPGLHRSLELVASGEKSTPPSSAG
jgi:hypothetical protein